MEKLIELLNEYDEGGNWRKLHWKGLGCEDYDTIGYKDKELTCEQDEIVAYLISKKFGFIKRLVENKKIETNNLSLKAFKNIFSGGGFVEVSDLEVLLMLLAISDTPIEDLISYLK